MTNKHLTIENLDNLQELKPEEVFSIQGGLIAAEPEYDYDKQPVEENLDRLIYHDPKDPLKPYPDTKPYYPWPYYPCKPYSGKYGYLIACPVIL